MPDFVLVEGCYVQCAEVAWRGDWDFFGVYLGWGLTAIGGGRAVTTVNRRNVVDSEVVTSLWLY